MKPEPHVANPLQVSDRDPSFLSGRLRPGIEAAPWVIQAIERLEAELAEARNQLTVIDPRDWEPCTPDTWPPAAPAAPRAYGMRPAGTTGIPGVRAQAQIKESVMAICLSLLQESVISEEDEEIYVCQCCGHEDHPDGFGAHCPSCGTDLDAFEEPGARYPIR